VVVVDGQPLLSSAVFAAVDGTLFVGQEAERQAAIDPSRFEPNPKRRIDEGELLLGNTVISVLDVVRAVLSRAVGEARRLAGNARVDLLVLTHPADWGAIRTKVLRQAAAGLAAEVTLVPEPVAAAVFHAASHTLADGATLAVLDLGGGTVDVSVVRRLPAGSVEPDRGQAVAGFQVLATHGDPNFGGADIDQLLLEHVGSLLSPTDLDDWRSLTEGRELPDRRRRRVLRQDVRGAKETLSRHTYTDVPMPPPMPDAHVTRDDLEKLIAVPLRRAAALTSQTIIEAGLRPDQLAAVFLVGGSSRIPLVARLVYQRVGIIPTTLDQPETVVARGALRAVAVDPMRTGGIPDQATVLLAPVAPPGYLAGVTGPSTPYPGQVQAPPRPVVATRFTPASTASVAKAPPRRGRRPLTLVAGVVVAVAAVVGGFLVFGHGGGSTAGAATTSKPTPTTGELIAQYDYRFTAPQGWTQSASNSSELLLEITPTANPTGGDGIYVQEFPLSYDGTKNRATWANELQRKVDDAGYLNFRPTMTFANRTVAYYQQPGNDVLIDWYVLLQGKVQVSIGCQYPTTDQAAVATACQQVVRGMTITK
ncbi:MAG TPA: type VII secretion-associated protein, partial [Pseudonocardiaceae bacterium]|nr:type VII secretion-associated protein [Pseudonocardiaceae bacterium]